MTVPSGDTTPRSVEQSPFAKDVPESVMLAALRAPLKGPFTVNHGFEFREDATGNRAIRFWPGEARLVNDAYYMNSGVVEVSDPADPDAFDFVYAPHASSWETESGEARRMLSGSAMDFVLSAAETEDVSGNSPSSFSDWASCEPLRPTEDGFHWVLACPRRAGVDTDTGTGPVEIRAAVDTEGRLALLDSGWEDGGPWVFSYGAEPILDPLAKDSTVAEMEWESLLDGLRDPLTVDLAIGYRTRVTLDQDGDRDVDSASDGGSSDGMPSVDYTRHRLLAASTTGGKEQGYVRYGTTSDEGQWQNYDELREDFPDSLLPTDVWFRGTVLDMLYTLSFGDNVRLALGCLEVPSRLQQKEAGWVLKCRDINGLPTELSVERDAWGRLRAVYGIDDNSSQAALLIFSYTAAPVVEPS